MAFFSSSNISLASIPLVWFLAMVPRIYARIAYRSSAGKDMDMRHPRQFSKTVAEDNAVNAQTRGRIGCTSIPPSLKGLELTFLAVSARRAGEQLDHTDPDR